MKPDPADAVHEHGIARPGHVGTLSHTRPFAQTRRFYRNQRILAVAAPIHNYSDLGMVTGIDPATV